MQRESGAIECETERDRERIRERERKKEREREERRGEERRGEERRGRDKLKKIQTNTTSSCSGPIQAQTLQVNSVSRAVFYHLKPKMVLYHFRRFIWVNNALE